MRFFKRRQQLKRELEEYKREFYILHLAIDKLIEKGRPGKVSLDDFLKEKNELLAEIRAEIDAG